MVPNKTNTLTKCCDEAVVLPSVSYDTRIGDARRGVIRVGELTASPTECIRNVPSALDGAVVQYKLSINVEVSHCYKWVWIRYNLCDAVVQRWVCLGIHALLVYSERKKMPNLIWPIWNSHLFRPWNLVVNQLRCQGSIESFCGNSLLRIACDGYVQHGYINFEM